MTSPAAAPSPTPPPASAPVAPARGLRRYLGIYGALWRNSVVRELGFKSNFLLWIVVELLWFALQITFISVIYSHTDRIGDWTKWEVVLLVGASHFIQQIFTALFLTNCVEISEYIRTGRLDFMLLLPINTRFIVSFRKVDLGGFVNAASALLVMAYAARQLHLSVAPLQIGGFLLLCAAGILVHYSLLFLLSCVSFWTVRAQGIVWGYYNLFNISRLPDAAFHGFFKIVFTYALPMLLVANVPAKVMLAKLGSLREMLLLLGLSVLCFIVSETAWRFSLRRYTSASS
jgi:ABC-2 type transport system permease protein